MTEQEERNADLHEKIAKLEMENEELRERIKSYRGQINRHEGVIDGLKFAIRCNGISGGEVTG